MKNKHTILIFLLFCNLLIFPEIQAQKKTLNDYNVSWSNPGINSQGSMPLGNGDIGINVWVEENGDLVFYLSKTDTWNENGQLLKLGKIRVSLFPNPFEKGFFLQELKLEQGEIEINYSQTKIKLWVDANHPTVQVDIYSKTLVNAQISFETWRKNRRPIKGLEMQTFYGVMKADKNRKNEAVFQEPDSIFSGCKNQIIWCHHNNYDHWSDNLELLSLKEYAENNDNPLLNRTFGALISLSGFVNQSDTILISRKPSRHFQVNIYPHTQIGSVASWAEALAKKAKEIQRIPSKVRKNAHIQWWHQFWNRNYIYISSSDSTSRNEAEIVTQGYILQRFVNACGGRGNFPVKFNGSIFTVDNFNRTDNYKGFDADFRLWGGPYWWQNTRLPYWSMIVSGDFEMMKPLFSMYLNALPIRKLATRKYYAHDGAFFPETINFWGTHTNVNYGFDRAGLEDGYTTNPYIRYYWQSGLELSLMMLDYYSFTNNDKFANDTLVPLVSEVLTFFDQHWKRGIDGKILFSPAMSLETYHTAVNPMPEIVGIRAVAEKMLALPPLLTTETQRRQWGKLINDLPEVPKRIVNNETVLVPAVEYSNKANTENPELYAIFPYRTYGIGKPDIEMAKRTFAIRTHKENGGWQQNSIQAAYLGLTDEAKRMIVESFSTWDKNFRFPAFWGPNYDWTPDQSHGNVAMIALQRMIVQYENDKVYLFPSWPKEWNVRFKINAPNNTIIEGIYENGQLVKMNASPLNRVKIIQ